MTVRTPLIAAGLCLSVLIAAAAPASPAPQRGTGPPPPPPKHVAHASAPGINLTVSIDDVRWKPAGNRAPGGMLFSHDAHIHGLYSIAAVGHIESGTVAAGFLLGCGVSAAGGLQIGLTPSGGLSVGYQQSNTLPYNSTTYTVPPTTSSNVQITHNPPTVALEPSVGANAGLSEGNQVTLEPGQVVAVVVANAALSPTSTYPYRLSVDDAAINVSQCFSPGSAVPFVTAAVSTNSSTAQTAAYGDQFTF